MPLHSPNRPIRRSTDTPTDLHRSRDTVRAPSIPLGSPPSCSVCHSNRSHTDRCRSCTDRARCTVRRTAWYYKSHCPSHPRRRTFRPHIGRASHSPGRRVLHNGNASISINNIHQRFFIYTHLSSNRRRSTWAHNCTTVCPDRRYHVPSNRANTATRPGP